MHRTISTATSTATLALVVLALAASAGACKDTSAPQPALRSAPVAPSNGSGPTPTASTGSGAVAGDAGSGAEYIPAENKQGAGRWKDTGVYVDGKPVAFLNFGELPVTLKPVWVTDKVSETKRPGSEDLGWRWAHQRFYRFDQYLTALGIDLHKVKEVHVYGPRLSESIIASGKDMLSPQAAGFMFRFGGNIFGKAIPLTPYEFGNGKGPDKLSGVMVYIDKQPPTMTADGLELDGVPQKGVPYFGEPLRGGVRVYLDDRFAMLIKRQDLKPAMAVTAPDGELQWKLADVLKAAGVDTSHVVELWAVRDELRQERYSAADLATLTFEASSQAHGGVMLGGGHPVLVAIPGMPAAPAAAAPGGPPALVSASVIALHTKAVRPDQLAVVLPDDL